MASTQRQVFSDQRCSGPDYFDMWHDYMDLNKLLQRLRDVSEVEANRGESQKRATASFPPARKDSTSSLSSLSDHSQSGSPSDYCRFCKHNRESARVYRSHRLKAEDGRVVCPVLSSYTCPVCEATGEQAHTRKYCPQLQRQEARRAQRSARW